MKTLLIITLAFLPLVSRSQNLTAQYFDKDWLPASDSSKATYYRIVENNNGQYIARNFYMSGKLQMLAPCSEISPRLKMDGHVTWYYENGTTKEEGTYKDGFGTGTHNSYYPDGTPRLKLRYDKIVPTYLNYWSVTGEDLLPNGTGIVEEDSSTPEKRRYTQVKMHEIFASFSVTTETSDTVYTRAENMPEYIGGHSQLSRDLRAHMKYPKDAQRNKIDGTVYVQFVIDKQGNISNTRVIRGLYPSCDEAALDAVQKLTQWSPGSHEGKLISMTYVLPVKFIL